MKNLKSINLTLILFMVMTLVLTPVSIAPVSANTGTDTIVTFTDHNLEAAVRDNLGNSTGDIMASDMQRINTLDASTDPTSAETPISSLEGLQYATSLDTLYLSNNSIQNFQVLGQIPSLTDISIPLNKISDLSGIENLVNLDRLVIYKNKITDLSKLTGLQNLSYLDISDNLVTDLTPLLNLPKLAQLHLDNNPIQGSEQMGIIKTLNERGVDVYFEGVTAPISLYASSITENSAQINWSYNGFTTFAGFKLYVDGTLVDEFDADTRKFMLSGLKWETEYEIRVEGLDASGNVVNSETTTFTTSEGPSGDVLKFNDKKLEAALKEELGIVNRDIYTSDAWKLDLFFAEGEGITDLTGIEHFYNVKNLKLTNNNIQNVDMLSELSSLDYLFLDKNNISDVSSFSDLTQLTSLILSDNNISDISSLNNLKQLGALSIDNNNISDLTPIQSMTNLRVLNGSGNPITSTEPIAELTNMETLYLRNTGLSNISFLENLTKLKNVYLDSNKISDIGVLENLPNLKIVGITDNSLDLTEGSEDFKVIKNLLDRGVDVDYESDKQYLFVDGSTDTTATISWNELQSKGIYTSYKVYLNGDLVTTLPAETKKYTFEKLNPNTIYMVKLVAYVGDKIGYDEITLAKTISSKNEDSSNSDGDNSLPNEDTILITPDVKNGVATLPGLELLTIENGGNIKVDLSTDGEANLKLPINQVEALKSKNANLIVSVSDVDLVFNTSNLLYDGEANITINKVMMDSDENIVSNIYDFTIIQGGKVISTFAKPVELSFDVDLSKVKNPENLSVYYYNETTEKWEEIGGVYKAGKITAQTSHFSTYTVIEKQPKTNETNGTEDNSQGNKLPKTASNYFNYMALGVVLVLIAVLTIVVQRNRRKHYSV